MLAFSLVAFTEGVVLEFRMAYTRQPHRLQDAPVILPAGVSQLATLSNEAKQNFL